MEQKQLKSDKCEYKGTLGVAFGRFTGKSKPQFSCKKGSTHTLSPDDFFILAYYIWEVYFQLLTETSTYQQDLPQKNTINFHSIFPKEKGDRGENPKEYTFSLSFIQVWWLPSKISTKGNKGNKLLLSLMSLIVRSLAEIRARSPSSHTCRVTPVAWEETSPITTSEAFGHTWCSCHSGEIL